jgi:hypothetical protein
MTNGRCGIVLIMIGVLAPQSADEVSARKALLAELQPITLRNCELARFGSANDGGYLMCGNLARGIQAAYSYGIGWQDDWGCEIATRFQVPVHQYDCFDPNRPGCASGRTVFHSECIGVRREQIEGRTFDTWVNQVAANHDAGKRLIIKLDVEGAEWDALMATPDEVLGWIEQLPMELHGVDEQRFVEVLRKLKRTFYLVNVHFNNNGCSDWWSPLPARSYQVLFVNKRIGVLDARRRGLSAAAKRLNAVDNPSLPDCQLLR